MFLVSVVPNDQPPICGVPIKDCISITDRDRRNWIFVAPEKWKNTDEFAVSLITSRRGLIAEDHQWVREAA
jgi:hypothetical protein